MSTGRTRRVVQHRDGAVKLQIVQEVLRGERPQEEICREHQVSRVDVWRWKKAYARLGEAAFATAPKGRPKGPRPIPGIQEEEQAVPKSAKARIAELERLCGRLTLENELLKKVLGRVPLDSDTP